MPRIQFITTPPKNNKRNLIKIFLIITSKKAGVHAAYLQATFNHSTHRIEMAKEEGAYLLLTQLPVLSLTSERGLELIRESGEPMKFGIFDFYKVFSRAFCEEGDGAAGTCMEAGGMKSLRTSDLTSSSLGHQGGCS
ncbi:MAG: hypothetical protein HF976_04540 [ANME-2 cluster archaeon]|nr:hypothetical protein [ANME-2 cluster archaeon]MBC2706184.1 hypothetical protein [ANME-2 cluster archaeon]MBC2747015.1 hypothetical protein [ANME-2 cluster archaeon]